MCPSTASGSGGCCHPPHLQVRKLRLKRGHPVSVEEPQPGAGSDSACFLLHLSFSSILSPSSSETELLCHLSLCFQHPAHSSRRWAVAGFCGTKRNCPASPNAVTSLLYMALHTRISLLHARLCVSCTYALQLGHTCPWMSQRHR